MNKSLKKISAVIAVLSLMWVTPATAALTTTADGAMAIKYSSLGSYGGTPMTVCGWWYPTSSATDRQDFWGKANTASPFQRVRHQLQGTTGLMRLQWSGTSNLFYDTATGVITMDKWWYICTTIDTSLGTGAKVVMYLGDRTSTATALSMTATAEGSGYSDVSAQPFQINNYSDDEALGGSVGWVAVWNRVLSANEIRQQQFRPHKTSGCLLMTFPGFTGLNAQKDYCGNDSNTGTISGSVTIATVNLPIIPF